MTSYKQGHCRYFHLVESDTGVGGSSPIMTDVLSSREETEAKHSREAKYDGSRLL